MFQEIPEVRLSVDYGGDLHFEGDASAALAIDITDLLKEAATNSSKIMFWGSMLAEASFAVAAQKQETKAMRAARFEVHYAALLREGLKPTEANVNSRVEQDSTVIESEATLARLLADEQKCKAAYAGVQQRKDMILAINRIVSADGGDEVRDYTSPARRSGK